MARTKTPAADALVDRAVGDERKKKKRVAGAVYQKGGPETAVAGGRGREPATSVATPGGKNAPPPATAVAGRVPQPPATADAYYPPPPPPPTTAQAHYPDENVPPPPPEDAEQYAGMTPTQAYYERMRRQAAHEAGDLREHEMRRMREELHRSGMAEGGGMGLRGQQMVEDRVAQGRSEAMLGIAELEAQHFREQALMELGFSQAMALQGAALAAQLEMQGLGFDQEAAMANLTAEQQMEFQQYQNEFLQMLTAAGWDHESAMQMAGIMAQLQMQENEHVFQSNLQLTLQQNQMTFDEWMQLGEWEQQVLLQQNEINSQIAMQINQLEFDEWYALESWQQAELMQSAEFAHAFAMFEVTSQFDWSVIQDQQDFEQAMAEMGWEWEQQTMEWKQLMWQMSAELQLLLNDFDWQEGEEPWWLTHPSGEGGFGEGGEVSEWPGFPPNQNQELTPEQYEVFSNLTSSQQAQWDALSDEQQAAILSYTGDDWYAWLQEIGWV